MTDAGARPRWGLIGQNDFGGAVLASLADQLGAPAMIVTRPAKVDHPNAVERVAAARGFPVESAVDHDVAPLVPGLAQLDVAVCAGWARHIPRSAREAPRYGILNLHPGPLPVWAGSDPIGWQLATGQTTIGLTVHKMTGTIDAGPVLATGWFTPEADDTGATLRVRAGTELGRLAAAVLTGSANDASTAPAHPVTPPLGMSPAITPATMTRDTVDRVLRAFSPHPGVVVRLPDEILVVRSRIGSPPGAAFRELECRDGSLGVLVVVRAEVVG